MFIGPALRKEKGRGRKKHTKKPTNKHTTDPANDKTHVQVLQLMTSLTLKERRKHCIAHVPRIPLTSRGQV